MLRIAVDHSAAFNQGAGIGRYARNLVGALPAALPDSKLTLVYAPEAGTGARFKADALAAFPKNVSLRIRSTLFDRRRMDQIWFRARLPLPIELWAGRQDVVYSPDFTAPPSFRTPRIVTIHDLAFQVVPERAPAALRTYLEAVVPRMVRESAAIAAVSETTKRDLIQRLGTEPSRITVIPNAVDARFFAALPPDQPLRDRLGLPVRYLLTVGTLEPRKNHLTLFEAIKALPDRSPPLVVVGRAGWDSDLIVSGAKALASRGRVILLDYVDDHLLPCLYAGAEALIYPSWYEGFGLPVLEGLAAGVPVIASDVPAHREVGQDAVVFVDPADADGLRQAINSVVESTTPNPVAVERRKERARGYSWEKSGEILASLLRSVSIR